MNRLDFAAKLIGILAVLTLGAFLGLLAVDFAKQISGANTKREEYNIFLDELNRQQADLNDLNNRIDRQ